MATVAAGTAAVAAFPAWAAVGPSERRAILSKAADPLRSREGRAVEPMAGEGGGTLPWAVFNVRLAADLPCEAADPVTAPRGDVLRDGVRKTYERTYPYPWPGILAEVPPSCDELTYAHSPPRGFAPHSMRSPEVGRLHLRVPNGTDPADWSDERVRVELAGNHTGLPFG